MLEGGRWRGEIREPWSWLVASAALAIAVWGVGGRATLASLSPPLAVVIGFIVHEMAHKLVARRGGMRAEFVATREGLVITILSALLPLKILAPGYVRVYTHYRISPRWAFYSVAAGPASNIAIALVSLGISMAAGSQLVAYVARVFAEINAWLALFNLIPVSPLDGYKILSQDWRLWLALSLAAGALYYLA